MAVSFANIGVRVCVIGHVKNFILKLNNTMSKVKKPFVCLVAIEHKNIFLFFSEEVVKLSAISGWWYGLEYGYSDNSKKILLDW